MIKKIFAGLVGLLVLLVAVVVGRTLLASGTDAEALLEMPLTIAVDDMAVSQRLGEALQFKTISSQASADDPNSVDRQAFVAFRDWLSATYPNFHGAAEREIISGYSLLFTWKGTDPGLKPILLMSHIDVVPIAPGTEGDWEQPPFSGAIADGYIWGRGAIDTKGSLIAMVEAAEALIAQGFQPKRTIMFSFGHDEEIGGSDGNAEIAKLLKERGIDLSWIADEGGVVSDGLLPGAGGAVGMVGIAEKGYVTLTLTARATGGHSSMPPRQTAVGQVARAVDRVQSNPFPASLDGPTGQMLDTIAGLSPFTTRMVFANRWLFGPLITAQMSSNPTSDAQLRTTIAPTIMSAGVKENVLPTVAEARINFRIHPEDSIDGVIAHVTEVIDDEGIEISVSNWGREPSVVSNTDSDGFKMLQSAIHASFDGAPVAPYLVVGGTDSRHYSEVTDAIYRFIPIIMGPSDGARFHGTNERVSVANMGQAVAFYGRLIKAAGEQ